MKLMHCPVNGLRPIQEFAYGGTFRPSPDPGSTTDREWAEYVFCRSGEPGLKKEWWYHIASGTWFITERNTLTDEIVQTYLLGSV